jgi:hypothetical protein
MEEELAFYKSIVQNARERAHQNYLLKREEILAKRKQEYKLKHPEPRRRGRPPLAKNLCDAVPKTDCK